MQIRLAPVKAPHFEGAALLIAADCTAYAYVNFHNEFIRGRIALIGCPKSNEVDYAEKLTQILTGNAIQSVTVVRMERYCEKTKPTGACKGKEPVGEKRSCVKNVLLKPFLL